MEETDHIGFAELVRLQKEAETCLQQALTAQKETTAEGMEGRPLPYRMSADWSITCVIGISFILLAYALRNGKKYIFQRMQYLFVHRERASLFDVSSGSDRRYTVALICITCILAGLCLFDHFVENTSLSMQQIPHALLLSIYSCTILIFALLKGGVYRFVNWVFFKKEQQNNWLQTYFDLWSGLCIVLFPIILLTVYLDLPSGQIENLCIGIWCFTKLLLFYKCVRNFFSHFHGILHLILYFCALEIIPAYLLWAGLEEINSLLTLKF